jgi:hypothetical protein
MLKSLMKTLCLSLLVCHAAFGQDTAASVASEVTTNTTKKTIVLNDTKPTGEVTETTTSEKAKCSSYCSKAYDKVAALLKGAQDVACKASTKTADCLVAVPNYLLSKVVVPTSPYLTDYRKTKVVVMSAVIAAAAYVAYKKFYAKDDTKEKEVRAKVLVKAAGQR